MEFFILYLLLKAINIDIGPIRPRYLPNLELYLSVGFAIKNEVVNVIKTPKGSREVYEYEIVMSI